MHKVKVPAVNFFQVSRSSRNMSRSDSDPDSMLVSLSDEEQVSLDSILHTPEEIDSPRTQDNDEKDQGGLSSSDSHDRSSVLTNIPMSSTGVLQSSSSSNESETAVVQEPVPPVARKRRFARLGENLDGSKKFRLIVKSCRKKVFLRRLHATKDLNDDFYIPNRAQLILDFLRKHGDRLVKERNGPRQSFPAHWHWCSMSWILPR